MALFGRACLTQTPPTDISATQEKNRKDRGVPTESRLNGSDKEKLPVSRLRCGYPLLRISMMRQER
jgi:hypothetical protein